MSSKGQSFSIILLAVAASLVGIACLRGLQVQYAPSALKRSMDVSWYWSDASPSVMESSVTSVLEGALSGIKGSVGISSTSEKGSGSITLEFGKKTDMAAARFEVASAIRNIWSSLPDGVTYPSISLGTSGRSVQNALTWVVKGDLPSLEIDQYLRRDVVTKLSEMDGVERVSLYGATPFEWTITFDNKAATVLGTSHEDIAEAFSTWTGNGSVGLAKVSGGTMPVKLRTASTEDFGDMPVKNVGGRVIHLRDIAEIEWHESTPDQYFRVNGLNTITMNIGVSADANLLRCAGEVKDKMESLEETFPSGITAVLRYDSSEYMSKELSKIYFRTGLCLLLLLLFVLIINRSWRYTLIIAATLVVNLLISVVIYYIGGVSIHIYTLAGITVSLGIIIDTSIVMIDHYGYYHNKKIFIAVFGAVITTVAAILVVLLLPEEEKANLVDFVWVIVVNLMVSLAVSYWFAPALIDHYPTRSTEKVKSVKARRRIVRWGARYSRYIAAGRRKRWIYVVGLVAAFGIPTCFLPEKITHMDGKPLSHADSVYNKIVGWRPYADNKNTIDKIIGTSVALFDKALNRSDFYREPSRRVMHIVAGMPEGGSVAQLSEVMSAMENYLAQYDELEIFTTSIYSYDYGVIQVWFKPEVEYTSFPDLLQSDVMRMASDFGGANWSVGGVNQSYFNNNVVTTYLGWRIRLTGYNFSELFGYGETLAEWLGKIKRVTALELRGGESYRSSNSEYNVRYDRETMASLGIDPYKYYESLSSMLCDETIGSVTQGGDVASVVLRSSDSDEFDLWNVKNTSIKVDSSMVKLAEVGSIAKEHTAMSIYRENQAYTVNVCFDFAGSSKLATKTIEEAVAMMNTEVLPIGYTASTDRYWYYGSQKTTYAWLILLVIVVIFVLLAIISNSLRKPLAVIGIIPLSFIGIFLTFGLTDFTFDQGGFASFVMVAALVVNAGIYLIVSMDDDPRSVSATRKYIRAFNHKIIPISLTIISTILGLIPFLFDGPTEVFWFDFAVGTIAGMLFSIVAVIFLFPIFLLPKESGASARPHQSL